MGECLTAGIKENEMGPVMAVWIAGTFRRYTGRKEATELGAWAMAEARQAHSLANKDAKLAMWD